MFRREDLTGAVSLTSVQMNLSRVIGPVIGAFLYAWLKAGPVFAINAVTYVFAVIGLVWAHYPRYAAAPGSPPVEQRLLSGIRIARADPVIRYVLLTLFTFSFFSATFVGIMPLVAKYNLGIQETGVTYGLLYATFGLGAAAGALTVGSVLAQRSKVALLRPGFVAFAIALAAFGLVRNLAAAFVVLCVVGYMYFLVITCLSIILQKQLRDEERGRIMALWIMLFGGTVPLGVLVASPFAKSYSTEVLLFGAAWALRARVVVRRPIPARERCTRVTEKHAEAMTDLRTRVVELVYSVDPTVLDRPAPATPDWRARDVLAHIVGVSDDVVNGRLDGIASDEWTGAQVERRQAVSVAEMLQEWQEHGPRFEEMLAGAPAEIAGQAVFDAATHEHDLRNAIERPGARDSRAMQVSWDWFVETRAHRSRARD